ncbi:ABC transporter permease [Baekduia soli]|nr:ABC transporter permease [Baekduia soli]
MFAAQVGYQNRMLLRSPMAAFSTLALPVVVLLAVTLLNSGRTLPSRGGIDFSQFFAPAMVAFAVMVAGYVNVLTGVTLARDRGVMKRMRGTPLPPSLYFAGRLASTGLVTALAAVAIVTAAVAVYDVTVPWSAMPAAALTVVVGVVCFAALGLAVAGIIRSGQSAMAVAWGTLLPLMFISDVFLPLDTGPSWLRDLGSAFPPRHLAIALETAFNPRTGNATPRWGDLGVLVAWAVAASITAFMLQRRPA